MTYEHIANVVPLRQEYPRPSYAVWCIADSPEAAAKVSARIAAGSLPITYANEANCREAWRGYPSPLAARHHPYRCGVVDGPTGVYVRSTSRLV